LKFSKAEIDSIFKILSAILSLGNVKFTSIGADGDARLGNEEIVAKVCQLLQVKQAQMASTLCKKKLSVRGEVTFIPFKTNQACDNRDGCSKTLYHMLFQKIVKRKTSKVKYLRDMYQGQVKKLVEDILPRDRDGNFRTKTYRNPWGKVSLRETKTKLAISDNMMAMRFAHLECPSAIKTTESILISMIPDDVKEKLFTDASVAEAFGFHVIEGDNTVSITTIEGTKDEAS
jgi:myosin heavy subunit